MLPAAAGGERQADGQPVTCFFCLESFDLLGERKMGGGYVVLLWGLRHGGPLCFGQRAAVEAHADCVRALRFFPSLRGEGEDAVTFTEAAVADGAAFLHSLCSARDITSRRL